MTVSQIETALTTQTLSSWHRNRSTNELLSLISRREMALESCDYDDLLFDV